MCNRSFSQLLLTALFLVFGSLTLWAQDNTIKGFVYEEATGEPMMFTNVYLKGTTFGSTTNENGYFNINRIPDGHYTLLITSVGYDTIAESFSLAKNQTVTRKYFLKETLPSRSPCTGCRKSDYPESARRCMPRFGKLIQWSARFRSAESAALTIFMRLIRTEKTFLQNLTWHLPKSRMKIPTITRRYPKTVFTA